MTAPPAAANATTRAIGIILVAMLAFAVMDGLNKIASQTIPIPAIMWVRNIVFAAVAIYLVRRQFPNAPLRDLAQSKQPKLQFVRALLLVIEMGMFMLAFKLMPLADVHAVNAATPLMVVAMSVPLLKEKVGLRRWAAVLAGFVGVLVIIRPGFQKVEPIVLLVLLAASLWGLYQIMVRICARTDSAATTSLWTAMIGLGATSAIGPAVWIWPDAQGWLLLAVIAGLGVFGHIALIRALGMTEPSALQPYTYTLFVWAIVVGYVMFGAMPDAWTLAGATIIIVSGLYAWHRERVRAAEQRAAAR